MTADPPRRSVLRLALIGATAVVITAGIRAAADIFTTIFMALFLALICLPVFDALVRWHVPGWLAVSLVITGMLIVVVAVVAFFVVSLTRLSATLPTYQAQLTSQIASLKEWLARVGIDLSSVTASDAFQPARLIQFVAGLIAGIVSALTGIGFILFLVAYLLIESASISVRLRTGPGAGNPFRAQIEEFIHGVSVYAARKTILGAVAAIADTALLFVLGVDFAFLWGALSFILSFIPNIGFLISLVPPVALTLIAFGPAKAIIVLAGYILINGVSDNVIGPRYMSEGVNLSPLVTFVAVMYWSWVLGAAGAFLALPLTILVKTLVLDQYADTRWLARLISARTGHGPATRGRFRRGTILER